MFLSDFVFGLLLPYYYMNWTDASAGKMTARLVSNYQIAQEDYRYIQNHCTIWQDALFSCHSLNCTWGSTRPHCRPTSSTWASLSSSVSSHRKKLPLVIASGGRWRVAEHELVANDRSDCSKQCKQIHRLDGNLWRCMTLLYRGWPLRIHG